MTAMDRLDLITTKQSKKTAAEANQNRLVFQIKSANDIARVINDLNAGKLTRYVELYNYILDRDPEIAAIISSRIDRVITKDYEVTPATNDADDVIAATFCGECLAGIPNLYQRLLSIAEAIPVGFSAHELEWELKNDNLMITDLMHTNPRRFVFTPQWELRISDYGMKGTYGEELMQDKWLIHFSTERQGDPCVYGLIRSIAYMFLFRNWTHKFWLHYSEVFGQPKIIVHVANDTPEAVVTSIREEVEKWTYDGVSVVRGETKPEITPASNGAGGDGFEKYLRWTTELITRFVLGSSDLNQAGSVGSLAAVQQRTSSVADPKRDRDAEAIAATIQSGIFKRLIDYNMHLFSKRPNEPKFRFKYAASDTGIATESAIPGETLSKKYLAQLSQR
jgi:phage gp29-like protein